MIANLRSASDADIERLLASPADITRFLYDAHAPHSGERLSLDRSWHAIHYALTGTRLGGQPPLNFLADQGTPVGSVDVGYGPARVLTSVEVRVLAARLSEIAPADVRQRLDPGQLDHQAIYPGNWQANGADADSVVSHYRALQAMISQLAQAGLGLVLFIN